MSEAVELINDPDTGVAHLWLNRPDTANAIDPELASSFHAAVDSVAASSARCVLIRGRGKMFCGGGNVKAFAADPGSVVDEVLSAWHPALLALAALDVPVVAAVHGAAAGAGLGLVGACDLVVAARSARFVMAYTGIGLVPDGSSSWFLPRIVGAHRMAELVLMNRPLTADEAQQWGIANVVVEDEDLGAQAESLATRLAAGPTRAFAEARGLLRGTWTNDLATHLAAEAAAMARAARTADAIEGIGAYVERRPARFSGN